MSGVNDWAHWMHPRHAAQQVSEKIGSGREAAIAALVRRLITGKIVAVTGEYRGPIDEGNHLRPDLFTDLMVLWRGLWQHDVFSSPTSSVWTIGDLDASLRGEPCWFLNIRLSRGDVETMLRECAALPVNDNDVDARPALPAPSVTVPLQAKWDWEAALIELVAVANHADGLEQIPGFQHRKRGSQARLEEWFASYFATRNNGGAPCESELRSRARAVVQALSTKG